MSFRFHPDAAAELAEAIQYYEDVEPGLGQDFAVEDLFRDPTRHGFSDYQAFAQKAL